MKARNVAGERARNLAPEDASPDYVPRLESLRGIGTWLVAAFHCAQAEWAPGETLLKGLRNGGPISGSLGALYRILCNGEAALIVFFIISGFVLTRSLERGPVQIWPSAKRFFVGRIFRLYPAIISTLLVFTVLFLSFGWAIPRVPPEAFRLGNVLRNMLLLRNNIDGVMWSLQLEVVAVFLIFVIARLERRWPILPSLLLAIALTILSFHPPWTRFLGPGKPAGLIYGFAFGIFLQRIDARSFKRRLSPRQATSYFLVMSVLIFAAPLISGHWQAFIETCAGTVMVGLLASGHKMEIAKLLDWPLLRFYGKISYSFYVLHPLSLILFWKMPGTINSWRNAGVPNVAIAFAFAVVSILAITPLAWLSWRFIEMPGIALGHLFVSGPRTFKAAPVDVTALPSQ